MPERTLNRESVRWLILEGSAIVASILLAFSIDAWWDDRRENRQRQELIFALNLDFEITKERLATSIGVADSTIDRTLEFLLKTGDQDQHSVEELGHLVDAISDGIAFKESLSAYESTVTTGKINLLTSPVLIQAIAEFYEALEMYENQFQIAGEVFYLGSTWELRRELGTLSFLSQGFDSVPSRFHLIEPQLRELYASKLVFAAVQNSTLVNFNIRAALLAMDAAADKALDALDGLE